MQIFDLEGALLAEAAAPTTRDPVMARDTDVLLVLQGRDPPGFGPTSVPTLARLGPGPGPAATGRNGTAPPRPPAPGDARGDTNADAGPGGAGDAGNGPRPEDAPSGSALSTLDVVALFGEAARDRFAPG